LKRSLVLFHLSLLLVLFLCLSPTFAQTNSGELHLKVTDPSGLAVKTSVQIASQANQYQKTLQTDDQGGLVVQRLPFGVYLIKVQQAGFADYTDSIQISSGLPVNDSIKLALSSVSTTVTVTAQSTLIDPDQAGAVSQIGTETIQRRLDSLPGRSLQDLVNSQPGWLYEGNAVLHPRGSEYQTQFVVDGIPLQDNRSPSFGPALEANDVQSMSIYTAGFPAEYGRKMGGVVEVNTLPDTRQNLHGQAILSGGSFDTAGAFVQGTYGWGNNAFSASATTDMTNHYLNPVVVQNYNNTGTIGDFSAEYSRQFTPNDRLNLSVRHELSRYDIPNEQIQQAAGQRQTADNFETMGIVSYQHNFSPHAVLNLSGMVRDNANDFNSNENSTPIIVLQHNWFREGYFKGMVTINRGHHEWKMGVESDNTFFNENTAYNITDPDDCASGEGGGGDDDDSGPTNACTFSFRANRPDLEQSAFIQDQIHYGNWSINAGLRWDHYQLILNRQAVDPRISVARYFPSAGLVLHFSYDRVFTTPSSENILLSSSTAVESIDPENFLRLPVEPSEGDYYEAGLSKDFMGHFKLDANYFRRLVANFADDDQIDNTSISFPIAFSKSTIYGAEGKIDMPQWGRFSGFASYSYQVGNVWYPVTGGLFFGDDTNNPTSGHFPDSQDQRNTVRGRMRFQVAPRLWVAGGVQFDSGLPFEFQCPDDETMDQCIADVTAQYGKQVVNRINFDRGRILPSFQVNASVGATLYKSERLNIQLQADGQNLNNITDVIDFGGLFSGNAIGPSRSWALRLTTSF
jgi:TonB-dependent Receptor Plug Domain